MQQDELRIDTLHAGSPYFTDFHDLAGLMRIHALFLLFSALRGDSFFLSYQSGLNRSRLVPYVTSLSQHVKEPHCWLEHSMVAEARLCHGGHLWHKSCNFRDYLK